jgi:propionate CoA-transferase
MRNTVAGAAEAVALIQDGDTIAISGLVGIGVPDDLLAPPCRTASRPKRRRAP